jgi:hypothetical protein
LKKIGINLGKADVENIINLQPGAIEMVLKKVYYKLNNIESKYILLT